MQGTNLSKDRPTIPLINSQGERFSSAADACRAQGKSYTTASSLLDSVCAGRPRWGVLWFIDLGRADKKHVALICRSRGIKPKDLLQPVFYSDGVVDGIPQD